MTTARRLPIRLAVAFAAFAAVAGGCATVGHEFPSSGVSQIRMGQTTQQQVKELFGEPWRTGVEDGRPTWTYGRYRYKLFGATRTKDLILRFDEQNRVHSYTFSTTEPQ
jgi:outer membrane protein assembly factor BamE (lipoprotein component of BamABCDE complex)